MSVPAAEGSYLFPAVPGVTGTALRDEATVAAATKPDGGQMARFMPLALETWPVHSCGVPGEAE